MFKNFKATSSVIFFANATLEFYDYDNFCCVFATHNSYLQIYVPLTNCIVQLDFKLGTNSVTLLPVLPQVTQGESNFSPCFPFVATFISAL